MSFQVQLSRQFLRAANRFFRKHPDLEPRYLQIIEALERDPFQPSLRLHPLRGRLEGTHAVSLTYAYRITLTLAISERTITLLDIGSHDEVYGRAR